MAEFELIENLPFTLAPPASPRIGLVVLASDYTIEREFRELMARPDVPPTLELFCSRIANAPNVTPDTLAAMGPSITESAERILPGDKLDVLAYGCTSASMVLGPDVVNNFLLDAKPEAATSNPASAAAAAMKALGAKRVAVLTPYRSDVNEIVRNGLEALGLEIPVFGSFNEEMDPNVARIDTASLKSGISTLIADHDVDAIFVSCTSIRLMANVEEIEKEIGLPVTSSNHAMAWHCLRQAGVTNALPGLGHLYQLSL